MNLVLDLDGCLFDFNYPYAKLLIKTTGEDRFPEGWKDDPAILAPVWDWDALHGYSGEEQTETWTEHILPEKKNFWKKLPLLPGAKEAIIQLNYLAKHGHNVYFMTHRIGENARHQTEVALYNAGMSFPTVMLCHAAVKAQVAGHLNCDIFIEDKRETAEDAARLGIHKVYLIDAACNRSEVHAGTIVKDVREVLELNDLWKIPSNS